MSTGTNPVVVGRLVKVVHSQSVGIKCDDFRTTRDETEGYAGLLRSMQYVELTFCFSTSSFTGWECTQYYLSPSPAQEGLAGQGLITYAMPIVQPYSG